MSDKSTPFDFSKLTRSEFESMSNEKQAKLRQLAADQRLGAAELGRIGMIEPVPEDALIMGFETQNWRGKLSVGGAIIEDRYVPKIVVAKHKAKSNSPDITITIDSSSGVPSVTRINIAAPPEGREIQGVTIKGIRIYDAIEEILSFIAGEYTEMQEGFSVALGGTDEFRAQTKRVIRQARKRRSNLSESELREIADIYNSEPHGGLERVQEAYGISRATAQRRISAAEKLGLIVRQRRGRPLA
ncbi:MAG: hypothetical protein MR006_05475 [Arcanobacterium sp.]|nr:hypothetical protein [Arcanobacterium sp.]